MTIARPSDSEIDQQIRQLDGRYTLVAFGPWQDCCDGHCSHGLRLIYEHKETGELRECRIKRPPVDVLMGQVRRTFEYVRYCDDVQIDPFQESREKENAST